MIITNPYKINQLSRQVIGACIEVHRILGPGLLEQVYHDCLCHELAVRNLFFVKEPCLQFNYKDTEISFNLKPDLIVEESIVVELKSVQEVHPVFVAQLLSYMRLTNTQLGLLINFNAVTLKDGIIRKTLMKVNYN